VAEIFSQLGTNIIIVKLVGITAGAGEWGKLKGILQSTCRIITVSSIVMVLMLLLIKKPLALQIFNSAQLYQVLIFGAAIIPLNNGLLLVKETFRGLQDLRTASFLPVFQQLVLLIALLLLSYKLVFTLANVFVVLIISLFLSLLVGSFILQRRSAKWKTEPVQTKNILKESLPMMVTKGFSLVWGSTDIFILGIYTNSTEVGIYGVVTALAATTLFSLGIINQVIPAMIAHYNAQKDFHTLSYVIRFASTIGAIFSIPFVLLLFLCGKYILNTIFGSDYAAGATALNLLAFGQLINSIAGSGGYVLQMIGHHIPYMKINISCGLLNIVLNILLARHFGKEGVAAATAISLIIQNILVVTTVYRKTGIWTMASPAMFMEIVNQSKSYLRKILNKPDQ